jgi:hypothetical protein
MQAAYLHNIILRQVFCVIPTIISDPSSSGAPAPSLHVHNCFIRGNPFVFGINTSHTEFNGWSASTSFDVTDDPNHYVMQHFFINLESFAMYFVN